MRFLNKYSIAGPLAFLALGAFASSASAQSIVRTPSPNPSAPLAEAVAVPPGFTTYYISGALPAVANADAPQGSAQRYGDTETQTASVLASLEKTLSKLGLTFADVVQAHVYLVGDPAQGGKMDFGGMNKAWMQKFATQEQPNRPARATVQVAALAVPGALVEIEFTAAKKP